MQSGDLRLLVGLGNPGQRYAGTRHNVGFMALEAFASRESTRFKAMAKLQGELAEVGVGSNRLRLLMPQTFMNESGRSIRAALDWFDLSSDQVLVLVDDMDLPLGRLRLRAKGMPVAQRAEEHDSASGYPGVRSLADWYRGSGSIGGGASCPHGVPCAGQFSSGGAAAAQGRAG